MTATKFLTVAETAKLLDLHVKTVQRMCREGRLPARRFGRKWHIDKAALEGTTT